MEENGGSEVSLVVTDYNDTISRIHPEIRLGKYSIMESIKEGSLKEPLESFFINGLKGFLKFRNRLDSTRLLENFGRIVEGRDQQIIDDFKSDYNRSDLSNMILDSLGGCNGDGGYYTEALDFFSEIPDGIETMVYSQSLENLIDFHLSRNGFADCFNGDVIGNGLEISEYGKIEGIEWNVDGPDVPPIEQKMDLFNIIDSKGYEPEEVVYIDNKSFGVLKELSDRGGEGILAPTADEEVKNWGRKNDIYVPDEWSDVGEYLGI